METDEGDLLPMTDEVDQTLLKGLTLLGQALLIGRFPVIGNAPNLNGGILTGRSEHGVIERVEIKVQDGTRVALDDARRPGLVTAGTVMPTDHDGSTAAEEGDSKVLGRGLDVLLVAR